MFCVTHLKNLCLSRHVCSRVSKRFKEEEMTTECLLAEMKTELDLKTFCISETSQLCSKLLRIFSHSIINAVMAGSPISRIKARSKPKASA